LDNRWKKNVLFASGRESEKGKVSINSMSCRQMVVLRKKLPLAYAEYGFLFSPMVRKWQLYSGQQVGRNWKRFIAADGKLT